MELKLYRTPTLNLRLTKLKEILELEASILTNFVLFLLPDLLEMQHVVLLDFGVEVGAKSGLSQTS